MPTMASPLYKVGPAFDPLVGQVNDGTVGSLGCNCSARWDADRCSDANVQVAPARRMPQLPPCAHAVGQRVAERLGFTVDMRPGARCLPAWWILVDVDHDLLTAVAPREKRRSALHE